MKIHLSLFLGSDLNYFSMAPKAMLDIKGIIFSFQCWSLGIYGKTEWTLVVTRKEVMVKTCLGVGNFPFASGSLKRFRNRQDVQSAFSCIFSQLSGGRGKPNGSLMNSGTKWTLLRGRAKAFHLGSPIKVASSKRCFPNQKLCKPLVS